MDRRSFIRYSAITSSAILIPWLHACTSTDPSLLPPPDFLSHTLDKEGLQKIGAAYLSQFPKEKSKQALADLLTEDFSGNMTREELSKHLAAAIEHDFATENTLVVAGWVLSRSEARQCALFSLTTA